MHYTSRGHVNWIVTALQHSRSLDELGLKKNNCFYVNLIVSSYDSIHGSKYFCHTKLTTVYCVLFKSHIKRHFTCLLYVIITQYAKLNIIHTNTYLEGRMQGNTLIIHFTHECLACYH